VRDDKFVSDKTYFTYDDVLVEPGFSLGSRDIATVFNERGVHPVIAANMDTIAAVKLCKAALKNKGIAILHRFMSIEDRMSAWNELVKEHPNKTNNIFISVGVNEPDGILRLIRHDSRMNFCIDIAHGHSHKMKETIKFIKENERAKIIAGNIATVKAYDDLCDWGADIIKVGIGPGSHCTTRIVAGCGVPQLSALLNIVERRDEMIACSTQAVNNEYYSKKIKPIIADGGIRNSGDIVKALVAGATYVMTGSLFAGCEETPGEVIDVHGTPSKVYRGMASKDAQVGWKKADASKVVAEGEASIVAAKGSYEYILGQLLGGLKSGMSYVGALNIQELCEKGRFIKVTPNTLVENRPHGKH